MRVRTSLQVFEHESSSVDTSPNDYQQDPFHGNGANIENEESLLVIPYSQLKLPGIQF